MKNLILVSSLFVLSCLLGADESEYMQFLLDKNASHLLEPGKLEISLKAGAVNDGLDIFNFKEDIISAENIDISQFSNFGDWYQYHALMNFGISKRLNLRFEAGFQLLEIGKSNAEIELYDFSIKYKLLNESNRIPNVSISLGYQTHISSNITGDINALTFSLDNTTISQTFSPPEKLTVGGLNDKSIYLGIHFGKTINEKWMLYSFTKFSYTDVSSEFETTLNIGQFQKLKNDFTYYSQNYNSGIGVYYQPHNYWLITAEYQFHYFKRKFKENDFEGHDEKTSHSLDLAAHYFINDKFAISLGGWINSNFLAGKIPLTFNRKSASKFDNPYGNLYIVFTFGFNLFNK